MYLLAFLLAVLGIYLLRRRRGALKRPPGPPGLPLIGNVFDMPGEDECHQFAEWRVKYGDLISLNCAGTIIVMCNSYQKAKELLDKKGVVYSNRASAPMATDLVGWKNNIAFLQYGKRFRDGRKLLHQEFGQPSALVKFHAHEEAASIALLKAMLNNPDAFEKNLYEHAGSLIMRLTYGYENQDQDLAALANKVMKCAGLAAAPSHFWVNMMPFLQYVPAWFPGAGFQRTAAEWRQDMLNMVNIPFQFTRKSMKAGNAPESFVARVLGVHDAEDKSDMLKWLAGSMFAGGSDTTYSTLYSFVLAMTLFPDVQRQAQREIDDVVGSGRLPSYADRGKLPYLENLVSEVLRFFSVVPIGIPHVAMEDDIHDGYFIPKGAIVFQNLWLMSHNPDVYKNPMTFDPTRFMGPSPEQDVREYCFGFGRRACPGKHLADISVWIACARILATLDIFPVLGKPLPTVKAAPGLVTHPVEFECDIRPRSQQAKALILDA